MNNDHLSEIERRSEAIRRHMEQEIHRLEIEKRILTEHEPLSLLLADHRLRLTQAADRQVWIHVHRLWNSVASIRFRDVGLDLLHELLEVLEPVDTCLFRNGSSTSFRPLASVPQPLRAGDSLTPIIPLYLEFEPHRLQDGEQGPTIHWWASHPVGVLRVDVDVQDAKFLGHTWAQRVGPRSKRIERDGVVLGQWVYRAPRSWNSDRVTYHNGDREWTHNRVYYWTAPNPVGNAWEQTKLLALAMTDEADFVKTQAQEEER